VRKIALAALGVALVSPSAAFGADLGPPPRPGAAPPPPPIYQPVFSWSGLYVGAQIGYGWGDTDATSFAGPTETYSYDTDGWLGGVHAGFNWQANALVIGLETDIELADVSGSGIGSLGSRHSTAIDWLGSLRGRIGLAAGRTLFYATGGLAYGDVSVSGPGYSDTETHAGWTAGAGIEHAFSPTTTARIEYRYTDLGSNDLTIDESDVTFSAVRLGLSFKF